MGGINVIPGLVDVGNSNFGSECVCGNNVLILSLVDVGNSTIMGQRTQIVYRLNP